MDTLKETYVITAVQLVALKDNLNLYIKKQTLHKVSYHQITFQRDQKRRRP